VLEMSGTELRVNATGMRHDMIPLSLRKESCALINAEQKDKQPMNRTQLNWPTLPSERSQINQGIGILCFTSRILKDVPWNGCGFL
jgi:hypothetical protein